MQRFESDKCWNEITLHSGFINFYRLFMKSNQLMPIFSPHFIQPINLLNHPCKKENQDHVNLKKVYIKSDKSAKTSFTY